jgi:hypothetical protein
MAVDIRRTLRLDFHHNLNLVRHGIDSSKREFAFEYARGRDYITDSRVVDVG